MTERNPPGLLSQEIIGSDEETVTIREVWDPNVEGCPMFVFERWTFPFKKTEGVESVTHTYKRPRLNGE